MAQSDKSEWVITPRNLEWIFGNIIWRAEKTPQSDFTLTTRWFMESVSIRVQSCISDIKPLFDETYPIKKEWSDTPTSVFHIDLIAENFLKEMYPDFDFKGKPSLTLYNPESRDLLIVESWRFDYGFVNTMILGIFSRLFYEKYAFKYAHAACLDIDGEGTLIVWDQWAGKSTLFSKLLEKSIWTNRWIWVLTDDWVLIQEDKVWLAVKRLSEEYRIELNMLQWWGDLLWENFRDTIRSINAPIKAKKITIPVDILCSKLGLKSIEETTCKRVVFLDRSQDSTIQAPNDIARCVDIMKASTFNVPPFDIDQQEIFDNFWSEKLRQMDVLKVNSRHDSESLDELIDVILGD